MTTEEQIMVPQGSKDVHADEPEKKTGAAAPQAMDDSCRCKEVSVMTPRQLLGLMMRDLAFWKKAKKG
jgi:hypothetical protein